jgi:hypothetical protein
MSTENRLPDWARSLFETIVSGIEFKGIAYMEGRYAAPDETAWGLDLVEIAPSIMKVSERGSDDGEECYGIIHNFDLMRAQEAFDEVIDTSFGIDDNGRHCITIEGKVGEREIVVLIYTEPFEDAEVSASIEKGSIREGPFNRGRPNPPCTRAALSWPLTNFAWWASMSFLPRAAG